MWKLAWRNLWRNRTRTVITATAIAFTMALMLFGRAIGADFYFKMSEGAERMAGGGVLVHSEGYWDDQTVAHSIDDRAGILETLTQTPGVQQVIERVLAPGLLSSPRGNVPTLLKGVIPADERTLDDPAEHLVAGAFLDGTLKRGKPIVLGRAVVEDLSLDLGDRVVLTATDPTGEMTRALFRLSGVVDTGSEMGDQAFAYTTLEAAQEALNLGDRIIQFGVITEPGDDRVALQAALRERLAPHEALEVMTWEEAIPEMVAFIKVDSQLNHAFGWIFFIIVAFGIMNTFLMAVLERIRELGLLSALGLTPRRIMQLILCESILLGLVSTLVGIGLAYLSHYLGSTYGIDVTDLGDMEISGVMLQDSHLRTRLVVSEWIGVTLGVLMIVVSCGLYPAWKATRLEPTEAMRTYE